MNNALELNFAANVAQAVQGIQKIEASFNELKGEAKGVSGALDKVSIAQTAVSNTGAGAAAAIQTVGAAVNTAMGVVGIAVTVVSELAKGFQMAEDAARQLGEVKVVEQVDKMQASFAKAGATLLSMPTITGKTALENIGDAAELVSKTVDGATESYVNLSKIVRIAAVEFQEVTGQISAAKAATEEAKIVNEQYGKSFEDAYAKAKANNVFALADSKKFVRINGVDVPVSQLPGRAIGGPVTAGQPVVVGERGPEVFVPPMNGRIAPNVAGGASGGGGMAVSQSVVVTVAAGAFLGSRSDANKLGQQLAPIVGRAQRQSASGGLRR